jgi:hypothetical protein
MVEPYAGDRVEENLNPIGRMYYAASAMACTPNSLSQEVGLGPGAQAGEERLRKVAREAGAPQAAMFGAPIERVPRTRRTARCGWSPEAAVDGL